MEVLRTISCNISEAEHNLFRFLKQHGLNTPTGPSFKITMIKYIRERDNLSIPDAKCLVDKYWSENA